MVGNDNISLNQFKILTCLLFSKIIKLQCQAHESLLIQFAITGVISPFTEFQKILSVEYCMKIYFALNILTVSWLLLQQIRLRDRFQITCSYPRGVNFVKYQMYSTKFERHGTVLFNPSPIAASYQRCVQKQVLQYLL